MPRRNHRALPPDWWDLEDDATKHHLALEAELRRELGPGHGLWAGSARAVAAHLPDDDVLFLLPDWRLALVHLTWRRGEEISPRRPNTTIFESWDLCVQALWAKWRLWSTE